MRPCRCFARPTCFCHPRCCCPPWFTHVPQVPPSFLGTSTPIEPSIVKVVVYNAGPQGVPNSVSLFGPSVHNGVSAPWGVVPFNVLIDFTVAVAVDDFLYDDIVFYNAEPYSGDRESEELAVTSSADVYVPCTGVSIVVCRLRLRERACCTRCRRAHGCLSLSFHSTACLCLVCDRLGLMSLLMRWCCVCCSDCCCWPRFCQHMSSCVATVALLFQCSR